jgi:hypothetical protein
MEKSNNKKTTQEGLPNASRNEASGLIYWEDYVFDNQSDTAGYLNNNFNIIYDALPARSSTD